MLDFKCEKCGNRNIVPESHVYFRIGSVGQDKNGMLCRVCCKEVNYNSEHCVACKDNLFCTNKMMEVFTKWLKTMKGDL